MLIELLIGLLIIGLIYWAITQIPLPPPVRTVAYVVLVIIAIIWLLRLHGVWGGSTRRVLGMMGV